MTPSRQRIIDDGRVLPILPSASHQAEREAQG